MDTAWWWTHLVGAGWTMVPLVACSVLALAVFLHKLVELALERPGDGRALRRARPLLEAGDFDGAAEAAMGVRGPSGRVIGATARARARARSSADAAGIAERASLAELDRFEAWVPVLAFVVQAAPMFGFLGTAVGMVDLFAQLEVSGKVADAGAVSGGIWKALLTTVAGLAIALPALAAHTWLQRRLELLRRALEAAVAEVLAAGAR
jgi:biopolymer transport protein ExbB